MRNIIFWCGIVSPHMLGLASEMAGLGYTVKVVTNKLMSEDRAAMGWSIEAADRVEVVIMDSVTDSLVAVARDAFNICSGIRGNGLVGFMQVEFLRQGIKFWVVMERLRIRGPFGLMRQIVYKKIFSKFSSVLIGVLSIGAGSRRWLAGVGVEESKIFDFAYFLPGALSERQNDPDSARFRIIFAGRLVKLKRVDWIIDAISKLESDFACDGFSLTVVGAGEEMSELKKMANKKLAGNVFWIDFVPINKVRDFMAKADCLVLPSIHDGWGAVASEALIEGTPVLCSDACGVAGIVAISGYGGVFMYQSKNDFLEKLRSVYLSGCITRVDREKLMEWSKCLTVAQGARYLDNILKWSAGGLPSRPFPPWGTK